MPDEADHGASHSGGSAQAAEWNARYTERGDRMWSGRPNGRLVVELADIAPGSALDVGCGEGADAIWLARHGWTVTAHTLLATLRPGGLLLAVYHDLDGGHREHMKERGVDPDDYVGVDDLVGLLGGDFTIESRVTGPRIDPPPGAPSIADVVLRARRV